MSTNEYFELLFDRPSETLITPKGENDLVFKLTDQYLPPEFEIHGIQYNDYFRKIASKLIPLIKLPHLPQFPKASQLPQDSDFSIYLPLHQEMAREVIDTLLNVPENKLQNLLATCVYARVKLNSQLFNYCYTVALLHRKDTKDIQIQNFVDTFPSKFFNSPTFIKARAMVSIIPKDTPRIPLVVPRDYTATDLNVEHRLAYFREDIGVNLYYWHWHIIYPFTSSDRKVVGKDRRGELFYYTNQQIMARYNGERLNNMLPKTKKFSNWRDSIPEAYFPKLGSLTSSRGLPPRQADMRWQDVDRPSNGLKIKISDMERWRRNLEVAVSTGKVKLPNGLTQDLDIDTLGNMVEASILSPNIDLYGSIQNSGHLLTAYIHDPTDRYLEQHSVMGDKAMTMRDPFFYCWQAWIDDLFQRYKESIYLRQYSLYELEYRDVQLVSASIEGHAGKNTLQTFWMESEVDVSHGLDFSDRGYIFVRYTHLNHRPFHYNIVVNNKGTARRGTIRIFIAPLLDERNHELTSFNELRKLMIEMDRFVVDLNPGENQITRDSSDSSVTIPFEQTFPKKTKDQEDLTSSSYCGCGWPQHMLVPKGTEGGAAYHLFVMVSNYDLDRVEQPDRKKLSSKEASSYCGLKDGLYPDKRPMGYPFDRPSANTTTMKGFILPNMTRVDVIIRHQNVTEPNPLNGTN